MKLPALKINVKYSLNKIKYLLRLIIIQSKAFVGIINVVLRGVNNTRFKREIEGRRELDICEVYKLASPIPYCPVDHVIDNNYYGISHTLRTYANMHLKDQVDAYIEHGVFFGKFILFDEKYWFPKTIITYSEQRKLHIESMRVEKKVVPIGPYIQYAKNIFSQEKISEYSNRFGKTLLVFPSHSIQNQSSEYDVDEFISEINSIRGSFQTVLVCLFWVDIKNADLLEKYTRENYLICTAGHIHDLNFLSRLRSIIELSNITISNNVGTHIGYCVSMGKPHYLFNSAVVEKNDVGKEYFDELYRMETYRKETHEVYEAFSTYSDSISLKQIEVVDKYWGGGNKKEPYEMHEILIGNQ
jgi:hypothetical protein